MRIAIAGGGPGGLYLAARVRHLIADSEVTVWERDHPGDTFGFGVVFSQATLNGIREADPELHEDLAAHFVHWPDIAVHYRDEIVTSSGHGFAAIGRKELLGLLRERCRKAGASVLFGAQAPPLDRLVAEFDLVVCADGAHSQTRARHREVFGTELDPRTSRYIWLATDKPFDALTFLIAETPHGPLHGHAYPFDTGRSTFIAEADERTWRAAGFPAGDEAPPTEDGSDRWAIGRLEEIFSAALQGHRLRGNRSRWRRFTVVRNRKWWHENVVLLGDAAHTTHFSVGSGTKLALEDALSLATCLQQCGSVPEALALYEAERRPAVAATQRAAQVSLEWFEDIGRVIGLSPSRFALELLTRSGRLTYSDLTAAAHTSNSDCQTEIK